jgi:dihydroorotase
MVPDSFALRSGVTTVVDAGSSGWRDFPIFKKQVIDHSKTRVLAFLNIVGAGMRGGSYEQDTKDMDGAKAAAMAQQYGDYIVGIKLAHYRGREWFPVDEAVKAGKIANIPVMIDFGENPSPLPIKELLLNHMRPGDIFTHCFAELKGREPIVDPNKKKLKPFVWEARKKGIVFGLGYGEISFAFSQAIPAIASGFYPNSLSTDMHAGTKIKMKDLPDIMSRFLAMGMSIDDVITLATWNPAREIKHKELGHISVGAIADITILSVIDGKFLFCDYTGYKIEGTKKFECEATIKSGKIVYDKDTFFRYP